MSRLAAADRLAAAAALDECRPLRSLPGAFYGDPAVHRADVEVFWRRGWVFAAHACELASPGDYVTLSIGGPAASPRKIPAPLAEQVTGAS